MTKMRKSNKKTNKKIIAINKIKVIKEVMFQVMKKRKHLDKKIHNTVMLLIHLLILV